jgi:hypothetical protein
MKHIETRFFYLRDLVKRKVLESELCRSRDNKADGFTKALETVLFNAWLVQLGMVVVQTIKKKK